MEKKTLSKYKLIRNTAIIGITVGTLVSLFDVQYKNTIPNYTESQFDKEFKNELKKIKKEKIDFQNKELQEYLENRYNNLDDLENKKSLIIDVKLNNTDFSDLKFFTKLEQIYVRNNQLNMEDLKYNQELRNIDIYNCDVYNMEYLPNGIEKVSISNTSILDKKLITPYFVKEVRINNINGDNILFKSTASIETLIIDGNISLDCQKLENANNLRILEIYNNPNIKNAKCLTLIPINIIRIDDYCPIWLTEEIYNQLPIENKNDKYLEEIKKLDREVTDFINKSPNEIVTFVLESLSYDLLEEKNPENNLIDYYFKLPITYALYNRDAVSINYTTYVESLCNRLGINSFTYISNNYSWINIENEILDLGYGEKTNNKYNIYHIDKNLIPENNVPNHEIEITYIGYMNNKKIITFKFNKHTYTIELKKFIIAILLINILYFCSVYYHNTKGLKMKLTNLENVKTK